MKGKKQSTFGNESPPATQVFDWNLEDLPDGMDQLDALLEDDALLDGVDFDFLLRDIDIDIGDLNWESIAPLAMDETAHLPATGEGETIEPASIVSRAIQTVLQIVPAKWEAFKALAHSNGYQALQQIIHLKDILNIVRQPG